MSPILLPGLSPRGNLRVAPYLPQVGQLPDLRLIGGAIFSKVPRDQLLGVGGGGALAFPGVSRPHVVETQSGGGPALEKGRPGPRLRPPLTATWAPRLGAVSARVTGLTPGWQGPQATGRDTEAPLHGPAGQWPAGQDSPAPEPPQDRDQSVLTTGSGGGTLRARVGDPGAIPGLRAGGQLLQSLPVRTPGGEGHPQARRCPCGPVSRPSSEPP